MPSGELASFEDLVIPRHLHRHGATALQGTPDEVLLNDLAETLEDGPGKAIYHWFGRPWLLRRGGKSGYSYLLQNVEDAWWC